MLAVLPFQNLTGQPSQEFLSDGFTEEMITQLGGLGSGRLGVIARTSAMTYKNTTKPVNQIGRELGVDYVLEGSVRRWGDRVRVTAQLIRTRDQIHLWAQNYESDRVDVLRLQSEITQAISDEIKIALSVEDKTQLRDAQTVDPKVYELELLGRYEWNKRTEAGLVQAINYFQQAIARDAKYVPAYAGLAEAYLVSAFYSRGSAREFYDKAQDAAQHAIQLNELAFQAHTTLGMVASSYLRPGAEGHFKRALAINQNYATAHHWYAFYLWRVGKRDEAMAEMEKARLLDPLSPIINTDEAVFRLSAGQTDQAIRQLQQTIQLDPNFAEAHRSLAVAYAKQNKLNEAMVEAHKALELNPRNIGVRATVGYVAAVSGDHGQAEKILRELKSVADGETPPGFFSAWIYTGLHQNAAAIQCLQSEYQRQTPMMVAISLEPIFEPLRDNPQFADLLRHIEVAQ
jgi:TolB-like protein/lipoprotein NlpI